MSINKTTNYGLNKPTKGTRNWDTYLNQNADIVDTKLKSLEDMDNEQDTRINNIVSQSGNDNTEIVDARLGADGEARPTLGTLIREIHDEQVEAKITPPIHNCTSIFTTGKGHDKNGNLLDYSQSVENGQVSVGVKGNTRTNIIPTFSSSEWTLHPNVIIDNPNKITLNADGLYQESNFSIRGFSVNKQYTLSIKSQKEVGSYIFVREKDQSGAIIRNNGIEDGKTTITFTIDANTDNATLIIGNNQTGTFTFENVLLEEGTEVKHFITGTKSTVLAQRIKSTGKNLFDINNIKRLSKGKLYASGNKLIASSSSYWDDTVYKLKELGLKLGDTYNFKTHQQIIIGDNRKITIVFLGSDKSTIIDSTTSSLINNGYINLTFTIPNQTEYIEFRLARNTPTSHEVIYTETQLEKGTVATPYKPYKEDKTYISCIDVDGNIEELRSLPNGVKDEVKDGKLYTKTNKVILDGTELTSFITYSLSHRMKINGWSTLNNALQTFKQDINTTTAIASNFDLGVFNISTDSNEIFCIGAYQGDLYIFLPKDNINNQTEFISYLNNNPITLTYQLATPKITPIQGVTPLQVWKNGTITIEPYLRKAVKYADSKLTFPIAVSEIEKIEDINGIEILDTDITLASDGLTCTITGALEGEVYTVYAPIRRELSTTPETVMSFPCNTKAQIESNSKSVQQLGTNVISLEDKVNMLIVLNS